MFNIHQFLLSRSNYNIVVSGYQHYIMSSITGGKKRKIGIDEASSNEVFEYTGKGQIVPKDVVSVRFHPSVTEVEVMAFSNCVNLEQVVFNIGLKKIGSSAFWNCSSLERITLPSTVTEIGRYGFGNCSLREITLSEDLRKIGTQAFASCKSLQTITVPCVTLIDDYAFIGCSCLWEVTLHEGIQVICSNSFYHCSSLQSCKFQRISIRLNNIIQTGHYPRAEAQIDEVRGRVVERRGTELFIPGEGMVRGRNWKEIRQDLDKIVKLIRYYEVKEATSLFELALWKAKLNQEEAQPINREACRVEVPGPIRDAILQYL